MLPLVILHHHSKRSNSETLFQLNAPNREALSVLLEAESFIEIL